MFDSKMLVGRDRTRAVMVRRMCGVSAPMEPLQIHIQFQKRKKLEIFDGT